MKNLRKVLAIAVVVMTVISLFTFSASAKKVEYAPYSGYEYNASGITVAAPITYEYDRTVAPRDLGISVGEATDFLWKNDTVYVLDSTNSQILELDANLTLKNVRNNFTDADGNPVKFEGAQGFTIADNGKIYVSDTKGEQILVFNNQNQLIQTIKKPDTTLVGFEFQFDVSKIMLNQQGDIYVVALSVNDGAFTFTPEGEFLFFFGKNTITQTAEVMLNQIKKLFMTREQIAKLKNYTPASIKNFDIDDKGFVYTVSAFVNGDNMRTVRKINYKGKNVFSVSGAVKRSFGDLEWDRQGATSKSTNFIDVDVDEQGFIHLLDAGRGRVFEYSADGQLISVFGGYGSQIGLFKNPVSIETFNNKVYVLEGDGSIVEFQATEYAQILREAYNDLDTSEPEKSVDAWQKVLACNSNSIYPYYGLAMAYEKQGDYKAAMEQFRLANSRSEYSDAFHEYRKQFISDNLWLLLAAAVAVIVGLVFLFKFLGKKLSSKSGSAYSILENKFTFPLYTIMHPSDGFGQFKYRPHLPSYVASAVIIVIFFLVSVFNYFGTGYSFNYSDPEDYSILATLLGTVVIYVFFVVGNWAVCSLLDGNGKIKEIASVTAYGLIPYITAQFISTVLSNVLTQSEGSILSIIVTVGAVWSAMIIIIGLSAVNQYYIGKTVLTTLLTFVAIIVLALISFLFFSLIQQVFYFFTSIWNEYLLR